MGWMADETGLGKRAANHVPLTPLSHLARAVEVFAGTEAVVYGGIRRTYAQHHDRVTRLASALARLGVAPGEVVATLLPNVPAALEAAFGAPACGAVLNTVNVRLDPDTVGYILAHGGAKVALVDTQFMALAREACARLDTPPALIEVPDAQAGLTATGTAPLYDDLLAEADPGFAWVLPDDEWESLSLNYTSGTTGRPKGVVYHHRGAYLMTLGTPVAWGMGPRPRYLTVVPAFHCNGWNHGWMLPLLGGTAICLRDVTARGIYDAIADEGVTHFGGAPIVLGLLVDADPADRRAFDHRVEVFTAGAPPAAATLAAITPLGFNVTQVYGLTETYGHITQSLWDPDWDALDPDAQASLKARQGVAFPMMEEVSVRDPSGGPVTRDGAAQGEIAMRGNCVMKGYYRDPDATEAAFAGGAFRSGDIATQDADGHMRIVDRAKDVIISGGENVSSIAVEGVLMRHPAVSLAAVVAMPHPRWGEVPCAFVETRADVSEADLIAHARALLPGFATPKAVRFGPLPKTSTGKVQKFALRARLADGV
ncbi:MAG: AMP-binding protein [Paracoccaceae bacterium]